MHELSVCQALLAQVTEVADREQASEVSRILLRIGPLSGVVPELLEQAFTIA
ncbi:MAG: hydrogenase maturation nickel metallochaperone HypA, partial [Pseudomonadota bacterium]